MKPHQVVFGAAGLMLLSSLFLAIAENFVRVSGTFAGIVIACGIGWGMLLTERYDVVRRTADDEARAEMSKRHTLR
jgi:uncharacterized membrane-anchored protein